MGLVGAVVVDCLAWCGAQYTTGSLQFSVVPAAATGTFTRSTTSCTSCLHKRVVIVRSLIVYASSCSITRCVPCLIMYPGDSRLLARWPAWDEPLRWRMMAAWLSRCLDSFLKGAPAWCRCVVCRVWASRWGMCPGHRGSTPVPLPITDNQAILVLTVCLASQSMLFQFDCTLVWLPPAHPQTHATLPT